MERFGAASYPGAISVESCQYTCSHGISPGLAVLAINPQDSAPAAGGDLVLQDGEQTIVIPDCRLAHLDASTDGSGTGWQLYLEDRRWRWRDLGTIAGSYNQLDPNGLIYPWTQKSPLAMIQLCLDAMGEQNAVITLPPLQAASQPMVDWDYVVPAVALQQLVESLGCRIVYRLDTDSVDIVPLGEGGELPEGNFYSQSPSLADPQRPDTIVCVGAPIRVQARFKLQPVGLDWDKLYRPLNALSYAPAGGWFALSKKAASRTIGPPTFAGIEKTKQLTKMEAIALCQASVTKCYQLVNLDPVDNSKELNLPYFGKIIRREQIILEDCKVEQIQPDHRDALLLDADGQPIKKHFYDGFRRDQPAECYGAYYLNRKFDKSHPANLLNGDPTKKMPLTFSIDPVTQVITFSDYVYNITDAGIESADPILETACTVRDAFTNQVIRYGRSFSFGPPLLGTKPRYIRHDDVQFNIIGSYTVSNSGKTRAEHRLTGISAVSGLGFDLADTIKRTTFYLLGEAEKYQIKGSLGRVYNGLMEIFCDGAIQQVTWHVGAPDGAYTTVSLNDEHSSSVPPYPARLRIEYAEKPQAERKPMWKTS